MICKKCGLENNDESKFCKECGNKLINECPSCSFVNEEEAKFCIKCGTTLSQKSTKQKKESKIKDVRGLVQKILSCSFLSLVVLIALLVVIQGLVPIISANISADVFGQYISGFDDISLFTLIDKLNAENAFSNTVVRELASVNNLIYILPILLIVLGLIISTVSLGLGISQAIKYVKSKMDEKYTSGNVLALSFTGFILMFLGASTTVYSITSQTALFTMKAEQTLSVLGGFIIAFIIIALLTRIAYNVVTKVNKDNLIEMIINNSAKVLCSIFIIVIILSLCNGYISAYEEGTSASMSLLYFLTGYITNLCETYGDLESYSLSAEEVVILIQVVTDTVIFIGLIIAIAATAFNIFKKDNGKNKTHLVSSIILTSVSLVYLIAVIIFSNNETILASSTSSDASLNVSSGVITAFVFSVLLLAVNITWVILKKKVINNKTSDEVLA